MKHKNRYATPLKKGYPADPAAETDAVLVIDNYDSFTYNLVHAIKKISGLRVDVVRNDAIELDEIEKYTRIVLSPGPGLPEEAGKMPEIIRRYAPTKSILGVCLGHQAIGEVFGAKLKNMERVIHGMATNIRITGARSKLYAGFPEVFAAGRYHSWIVEREELPSCLEITGIDEEGRIMSMKHKDFDVEGVQFHPESVLTPLGEQMLENWLNATDPASGKEENITTPENKSY